MPAAARTTFRAGLTTAGVVSGALELLDRDGVEAFSMRALARELGVQVSALYQHVTDRETALAEVVGLILAEVELPDPAAGWAQALTGFARSYRTALHRHAGAAPLVSGQLVSNGPQDFPVVEALLACLSAGGFDDEVLVDAYNAFLGWLVGFVGVELAPAPPPGTDWADRRRRDLQTVDKARFPLLRRYRDRMSGAFAIRWQSGAQAPMDDAFDTALRVVVSGLEALRR